jgi:hypothetical protein
MAKVSLCLAFLFAQLIEATCKCSAGRESELGDSQSTITGARETKTDSNQLLSCQHVSHDVSQKFGKCQCGGARAKKLRSLIIFTAY